MLTTSTTASMLKNTEFGPQCIYVCISYDPQGLHSNTFRYVTSYIDTDVPTFQRDILPPSSDYKSFHLHVYLTWWWRQHIPLKRQYISTKLHGVTFHKTFMFLVTPWEYQISLNKVYFIEHQKPVDFHKNMKTHRAGWPHVRNWDCFYWKTVKS